MNRRVRELVAFSPVVAVAFLVATASSPSHQEIDKVLGSPRAFSFTYGFTLESLPREAKRVEAWIPVPTSDRRQSVELVTVSGDWKYEKLRDPEYGNEFFYFDFSGTGPDTRGVDVSIKFRVLRYPYRALGGDAQIDEVSRGVLGRYLSPDRLVPIDGAIALEARRVAGAIEQPLARARAIYDHIVKTVQYEKKGDGWGKGDASYACTARSGNCSDFHSLFIAEARSLNIPARFIMGFPLPENAAKGNIEGYHCWAEFYVDGYGWVPVDASEAHKQPEKREAFFGGLDASRVAFTTGRDIRVPGASAGPLNFAIYPHVEVDGKAYDKVSSSFSFEEIEIDANRTEG